MKNVLIVLTAAAAAVGTSLSLVNPAAAQWGSYGLSPQQLQHQRGNGWSSGDYFGLRSSVMNHTHLASTQGGHLEAA